jgi:adenine/guanine phosphoribosyltransferase-like PRPP-binding protein
MHEKTCHSVTKLVDVLIATGGAAKTACKLIEKMGGRIIECCFIIVKIKSLREFPHQRVRLISKFVI